MNTASTPGPGKPSVLCVDDEPAVLDGLKPHLRRQYNVHTANDGEQALAVLAAEPSITAILSDMRMPKMDGAELLGQVRQKHPDTVRMLLTGEADLSQAADAVNDGQIFRFLIKPTDPKSICDAFAAAMEQHRIAMAERTVLQETLIGSLEVLFDVLSVASPRAFSRASGLRRIARTVATEAGVDPVWVVEATAMLSQIGAIALDNETVDRLYQGAKLTEEDSRKVAEMPAVAAKLLHHIPRLQPIRDALSSFAKGAPPADTPGPAEVLRVAVDFDNLRRRSMEPADAVRAMREREDRYSGGLQKALDCLASGESAAQDVKEVPLTGLRIGMVLNEDLVNAGGLLLVRKGQEISAGLLARLQSLTKAIGVEKVQVIVEHKESIH